MKYSYCSEDDEIVFYFKPAKGESVIQELIRLGLVAYEIMERTYEFPDYTRQDLEAVFDKAGWTKL